jgi:Plasmid replication region DNA-binding N-term
MISYCYGRATGEAAIRKQATLTRVRQAAEALQAEGQAVTVRAVRERLGGGSFGTIGRALKDWQARQGKTPVDIEELSQLRARVKDLEKRLDALEARKREPAPTTAARGGRPITRLVLEAAYRRAVQAAGFSDVLVSELARELPAVPLEALKARLLRESREGRAVPSLGDWSLSSAEARAAAISINGRPHLRIKLLGADGERA